jgi:large subunit ribosomal protein L10
VLDGKFVSPDEVRRLADLESRDVLLAKVAGALQGVLQQAVTLAAAPLSQAARLFAALQKAAEENPSLLASAPEATAESANEELAAVSTQEPTNSEIEDESTQEPTNDQLADELTQEPTNEELAAETAQPAASAAPEVDTTSAAEPLAAPAAEDN